MSKAKRNMKRPPRSRTGFGLILALIVSGVLGIGLAQWQPQWFNPILPQKPSTKGKRFVLASNQLFLPLTSTLRPETLSLLDEIARNFPEAPNSHIRILSYARSGQESLNLSYRRAIAVENYLKQKTKTDRYYWFASAVYSPESEDDRLEVVIN